VNAVATPLTRATLTPGVYYRAERVGPLLDMSPRTLLKPKWRRKLGAIDLNDVGSGDPGRARRAPRWRFPGERVAAYLDAIGAPPPAKPRRAMNAAEQDAAKQRDLARGLAAGTRLAAV
jgi:hypothetical protein